MARKKETAVAKKEAGDVAVLGLFAEVSDTGFEETTADDYSIPFIKLLQKGSPEVDDADPAHYIPGAAPGKFLDTSSGEILDEVLVVPCYYRRVMNRWKDREAGGGFVGEVPVEVAERLPRDEKGRFVLENGDYILDTRQFFCLRLTEDGPVHGVVSMTSTQIKKARTWLTRMQRLTIKLPDGSTRVAPMFSHVWRITSVPESNDQGSWRGYKVELVGPITDPDLARQAIEAHELFKEISSKVVPPVEAGGSDDDEIPF